MPIEITPKFANAFWTDSKSFLLVNYLKVRSHRNFVCSLLLSHLPGSLPVMASWVAKKVILDFLFLLHVENSTMEFPTMVKTKRTHRVINCSVCEKQSKTGPVNQWGSRYLTNARPGLCSWSHIPTPQSSTHKDTTVLIHTDNRVDWCIL